jgi:hypothetical protein
MRLRVNRWRPWSAVVALAVTSSLAFGDTVVGVTSDGRIVSFDSASPSRVLHRATITGLQTGETILGADFRPLDGRLYALGSSSRLYVVDASTGVATQVGTGPFAPALSGTDFGFDFNPAVDRVRVVSDAEQNLRLDPTTGAVAASDVALAYAATDPNFLANPNVVGLAYDRNSAGVSATTAFAIDLGLDVLVRLGDVNGSPQSPNGGVLTTVGPLGVNTGGLVGFDYAGTSALASITPPGGTSSSLYSINLTTGAATLVGPIGGGVTLVGISIVPQRLVAVNAAGQIVTFAPGSPALVSSPVTITGLAATETVVGAAVRPATGGLYALGSLSHLYRVNPTTGAATQVGPTLSPTLAGTVFGMDFDPTEDRIRVVSDADQNLRIHPDSAAVVADQNLAFAPADANAGANPNVVAVSFDSNDPTVGATTAFAIDNSLDLFVRVGSPGGSPDTVATGRLSSVGPLSVDAAGRVGFEIVGGRAFALIALTGATTPDLYEINVATGAVTNLGNVPMGGLPVALSSLPTLPLRTPAATDLVGLTTANSLVVFNSGSPGSVGSPVAITGLQVGENIMAIDTRPSTGVLYGVSDQGRLYAIDRLDGDAHAIGTTMTPAAGGASFGLDFDPKADVLRVVDDGDRNLRINPATGAVIDGDAVTTGVQGDTDLAYVAGDQGFGSNPSVVGVAYDRNIPVSPNTTLFGIDAGRDTVVRVGSVDGAPNAANTGGLTTVGPLGVDATGSTGFEIASNGATLAAIVVAGDASSSLFEIDSDTGTATFLGEIGAPVPLRGLAIAPTADLPAVPGQLTLKTLSIFISFCGSPKDSLSMSGTLPEIAQPYAGKQVTVDVGGFGKTFVLDAKGKGVSGDDKFALSGKPKNGLQKFTLAIKKEDVSDEFADEDLTGEVKFTKVERQIHVVVTIAGTPYAADVTVLYTSRIQHSGVAKLKK